MLRRLLLVEDEAPVCQGSVRDYLRREDGFDCLWKHWSSIGPGNLHQPGIELVVFAGSTEPDLPYNLFHWLQKHPILAPTLAVVAQQSSDEFLRSAAESVDDFVFSPVRAHEFHYRVRRLLGGPPEQQEELLARQRLKKELGLAQLVGHDPAFVRVIQSLAGIAASSAPVLLLGETGTGKEMCAQAIHALSPRHPGPFIPVECGAIPENLVENELFGHVRGAFTDAHTDQKGLAAMADGGTLFLDEIDSLPIGAQAKLLRFIQEGIYRPLGSQKFCRADIRLVAASNRDLEKCVREGLFRADLYFRLNVLPLRLPPLRERRSDIALLAAYFLSKLASSAGQREKKLSPAALRFLQSHDWPGNVRELYNIMQRAMAFCSGPSISPADLGLSPTLEDGAVQEDTEFNLARSRVIETFEKSFVEDMLRKSHGNVTRAALAAGKDRRVFGRLIKRYNLDRRAYE